MLQFFDRLGALVIQLFDRITNKQVRDNLVQAIPFWIASLLTGVVAVAYARLFSMAERVSPLLMQGQKLWLFALVPTCFLVAWWIVVKGAPYARGSGIPQVMAAIKLADPKTNSLINRLLSIRIILIKIASSLVMVAGGGAIGREGPTIQIAASVFHAINKRIPPTWPKLSEQSYILTGAAAGLAAAFNTPLGGVVFAMEELARIHVRFFRTALFAAVIISGLTAQGLLGPYLYLGYPDVGYLQFKIFFGVAAVALIAGFGGACMSKAILYLLVQKKKWSSRFSSWQWVLAAGLLTAAWACFVSPAILGSGKELMTTVLFTQEKQIAWTEVASRFLGPLVSFTTGAAGGVFAPSLSAGASLGAMAAWFFNIAGANANILILGGMVGFLTGITRTPFTSAILVLEMTDRHSVIFHLLLAALIAQLCAMLVDPKSLYDHLKKQYIEEIKP